MYKVQSMWKMEVFTSPFIVCTDWLSRQNRVFFFFHCFIMGGNAWQTYAQKRTTGMLNWLLRLDGMHGFQWSYEKDQTRKEKNTHLNFSRWSHRRQHEWSPLDLHARWGQTHPRLLCSWSPGTGACWRPVTASPVASTRHWWWQPCRVRKGQGCVAREPDQWRCLCGWAAWSWHCPGTAGSWTPCKTPGALFFSLLLQRQMVYMCMWQTPDISLFHP